MVDRVRMRHMLGPSMKFVDGRLDVVESALVASADITALEDRATAIETTLLSYAPDGLFNVADYTGGVALTTVNFEAAFRSAQAAAAAFCGAPENADANHGGAAVLVPPGTWPMADGIFLRATWPTYAPSIIGMGAPGSVKLLFDTAADFPGISIGTNDDGTKWATLTRGVVLQNLDLYFTGGQTARGGVRARATFKCTLRDVFVRGVRRLTVADSWTEAVGFDFRNGNVGELTDDSGDGLNHQHLRLEHCAAYYCKVGYWFGTGMWSCTATDNDANGCDYPALYEGATVGWFGGNVQSGGTGSPHNSGCMYTTGLPSGTGASMSADVGGVRTVTGLSSMLGAAATGGSATHKGGWLDLGAYIARIKDVLSATSCEVWTNSLETPTGTEPTTDLTWQVRGCGGGNDVQIEGGVYYEGNSRYLLDVGSDLQTASNYAIASVRCQASLAAVRANNVAGQVTCHNVRNPAGKTAVLDGMASFITDAPITDIDTDDFSRSAIVARYPADAAGVRGGVWDARPRGSRYSSALRERGAIVFDARRLSTLTLSGTDVQGWDDMDGVAALAPVNAGVYPQYIASDAGFGGPCVQLTADANTALWAALIGDVGLVMPAGTYAPTLMVVARISTAAQVLARRIALSGPGGFESYIAWDDQGHSSSNDFYTRYFLSPINGVTANLVDTTTDPHWLANPLVVSGGGSGGGGVSDAVEYAKTWTLHGNFRPGLTFPQAMDLRLLYNFQPSSGDLLIAHVAVIPSGLTLAEVEHFRDLARNEWPLPE